jgi:hypothetical protein
MSSVFSDYLLSLSESHLVYHITITHMPSPPHSITGATSTAYSNGVSYYDHAGDLHSLEMLEILPQILKEGIIFAGSGAALLLQAALTAIRDTEIPSGGNTALATELIEAPPFWSLVHVLNVKPSWMYCNAARPLV